MKQNNTTWIVKQTHTQEVGCEAETQKMDRNTYAQQIDCKTNTKNDRTTEAQRWIAKQKHKDGY